MTHLTVKEVAETLRMSEIWVRIHLADDTIPSFKIGGSRFVRSVDLHAYLERCHRAAMLPEDRTYEPAMAD